MAVVNSEVFPRYIVERGIRIELYLDERWVRPLIPVLQRSKRSFDRSTDGMSMDELPKAVPFYIIIENNVLYPFISVV